MNRIIKLISIVLFMIAVLLSQQIEKYTNENFSKNISEQMQISQIDQNCLFNGLTMTGTGRPIISIQQIWSTGNNCWENYRKTEIEYPTSKVSTDVISVGKLMWDFFWSLEDWVAESLREVHTDGDGNTVKQVTYNSQGTANQEIYYNAPYTNGQPATTVSLLYNGSEWKNSWQQSHTYNLDGDEVERIGENWDGSNWVLSSRSVQTYTQPDCLVGWTNYVYESGDWIAYKRATHIYDETDYMDKMVPYPPWPLKKCNPNKVITEISNDNGGFWTTSSLNYYTDFGANTYLPYTMVQNTSNNEAKTTMTYMLDGGTTVNQKVSSIYDNSNFKVH